MRRNQPASQGLQGAGCRRVADGFHVLRERSVLRSFVLATTLLASLASASAAVSQSAAPGTSGSVPRWEIDTSHSELSFRIRHLVSQVRGTFGGWSGTIVADPARLGEGSVNVTIQTASIDTNNERRDTHLRSDDFFAAEAHPTISFRSRRIEVDGKKLKVHGDLTMRGVTRPVTLEGEYLGTVGTGERQRLGFSARTTVDRTDYGVSWNRAAEGNGVVLGDDVEIEITVAAVRK